MTYYLIKEEGVENDTFAIILKRPREEETKKAIRTAINDYFDCDCTLGNIDLEEVEQGCSQIICATALLPKGGYMEVNVAITTAPLF